MTTQLITVEYLKEIVDAFNRHDVNAIASYFAEDGQFLTARGPHSWGDRLTGPKAIRDYLAQRYEIIPDMRWEGERHFISGRRALSEWIVKGTSATGEKIEWNGCDVWEFDGSGKIKVKDTFWKCVHR
jgi:taurine dehydrogenase small subunit